MGLLLYSQKGNNMHAKTNYIFMFFLIYTHSGPTSFFYSFAISIIECEHNRNHMITFMCLLLDYLEDFSVSISISDIILYGFSLKCVP